MSDSSATGQPGSESPLGGPAADLGVPHAHGRPGLCTSWAAPGLTAVNSPTSSCRPAMNWLCGCCCISAPCGLPPVSPYHCPQPTPRQSFVRLVPLSSKQLCLQRPCSCSHGPSSIRDLPPPKPTFPRGSDVTHSPLCPQMYLPGSWQGVLHTALVHVK